MSKEKARYFIALVPPEPVYSESWAWKEWFRDQYQTKKALNSPPHITLQMPFVWRQDRESLIQEALTGFASACTLFPISITGFAAFPPRVIYLDVPLTDSLNEVQKGLSRTMRHSFGIHNDTHKNNGFVPHLTVAFRDLKKETFLSAWEKVKEQSISLAWEQSTLSLLKHDGVQWQVFQNYEFSSILADS